MPTKLFSALLLVVAACAPAAAQPYSAFVTGTGYVETPPFYPVAPGQILTFFVAGLPTSALQNVVAAVTIQGTAQVVTVLSAKAMSDGTVAVTVQIPFTVVTEVPNPLSPVAGAYSIQFGENDNPAGGPCVENVCTPAIPLVPVLANAHVITTCDIFYSKSYTTPGNVCQQAVTHQNGQLVTASAPAMPGETVTIWALGLGAPIGGIPPNATGPIAMNDITLQANFESTLPVIYVPGSGSTPYEFAGLPSPSVGLYQINFAIPQPPVGTASCVSAVNNGFTNISGGNLGISLGRTPTGSVGIGGSGFVFFGFAIGSGANICVAV